MPFTILKPHFFMQNLMMAAQSVAQQGAMYFALADGKMGLIDSRDISDFAAHVLTSEGHEGKTYTLTGPVSLSMHQIAAMIGEAIGNPVAYVPVSVDDARQSMAQMGLDDWMVNLMCDYFAAYSANWGDLVTDDFQRVMGKAPRSIEQFARDFGGAFGKQ
ncbi:MAG: NmrA family NAD(P)-binding protein [Candidatus Methylumidiphilus sp.]